MYATMGIFASDSPSRECSENYPVQKGSRSRSPDAFHTIMPTRYLYIARHGEADAWGNITNVGRQQARLLGKRLAPLPVDHIWHSPLPRAAATAQELDLFLEGNASVREATELIDHVPYVPSADETPSSWIPFFDGYDAAEAEAGHDIAQRLVARFATAPDPSDGDQHEVLITHAYPIAWLIRDALDAPPIRWVSLNSANTGLTVIEYRPASLPAVVMFNDLSHLPEEMRWTGFPAAVRP